jgi:hypothetical protein
MNGRMYDPIIGRVLSPDKVVQAPGYTQSYNRYSYCMNNPLRYTDPSGWYTDIGRGINEVADRNSITFYTYGIGSPGNYYAGYGSGGMSIAPHSGGTFIQQLASSIQYLPSGYYNLTGVDYNNGSFEFTYDYNSAATEYYNAMADKANKQKAFNDRMTLGAASNIGYGLMFEGDLGGDDDLILTGSNLSFGFVFGEKINLLGFQEGMSGGLFYVKPFTFDSQLGLNAPLDYFSGFSFSKYVVGFSLEYNHTQKTLFGELSIGPFVINNSGLLFRIYSFSKGAGLRIDGNLDINLMMTGPESGTRNALYQNDATYLYNPYKIH